MQEREQTTRIKRPAVDVDEVPDVISGFPASVTCERRSNHRAGGSYSSVSGFGVTIFLPLTSLAMLICSPNLQKPYTSVDDLSDIDLTMSALDDLRAMVQFAEQVFDAGQFAAGDHVGFVQDNDVGEFDLVDHEIGDSALVLRHDIVAPRREQIRRLEVMKHGESVDDGASELNGQPVARKISPFSSSYRKRRDSRSIQSRKLLQPSNLSQTLERRQGALVEPLGPFAHGGDLLREPYVEGLSDLLGLADAAALDDDVVELGQLGEPDELLEQIAAQRAADAPILQRDDLFFGLLERVRVADQGRVDVDAAQSVHRVNQMALFLSLYERD
nr:hypothetical protein CFP56_44318 [Quercus suber]